MTSEEIRQEAIERIAKAMWMTQAGPGIPCAWEDAPEIKQWAYAQRAGRVAAALGDMLPTSTPDAWMIGYRDQRGQVEMHWDGDVRRTLRAGRTALRAEIDATGHEELRLFELREVR